MRDRRRARRGRASLTPARLTSRVARPRALTRSSAQGSVLVRSARRRLRLDSSRGRLAMSIAQMRRGARAPHEGARGYSAKQLARRQMLAHARSHTTRGRDVKDSALGRAVSLARGVLLCARARGRWERGVAPGRRLRYSTTAGGNGRLYAGPFSTTARRTVYAVALRHDGRRRDAQTTATSGSSPPSSFPRLRRRRDEGGWGD